MIPFNWPQLPTTERYARPQPERRSTGHPRTPGARSIMCVQESRGRPTCTRPSLARTDDLAAGSESPRVAAPPRTPRAIGRKSVPAREARRMCPLCLTPTQQYPIGPGARPRNCCCFVFRDHAFGSATEARDNVPRSGPSYMTSKPTMIRRAQLLQPRQSGSQAA